MRISGSGMARTAMRAIRERKEPAHVRFAISCFHDALLAVAKGTLSPAEVKDFFWQHDIDKAKFYGDVIEFVEKKPAEGVTP